MTTNAEKFEAALAKAKNDRAATEAKKTTAATAQAGGVVRVVVKRTISVDFTEQELIAVWELLNSTGAERSDYLPLVTAHEKLEAALPREQS